MAASPAFNFVASSSTNLDSLYEAPWEVDGAWAGYLLPATENPPTTISFKDSLCSEQQGNNYAVKYQGYFLFCSTRPAQLDSAPSEFIDELMAYLKQQHVDSQIVFWITADYLQLPSNLFSAYSLKIRCDTTSTGRFFVSSNCNSLLGNDLHFNILLDTQIQIDEANESLKFSGSDTASPPNISFLFNGSDLGISITGSNGYIRTYVPFTGTQLGCCTFTAQIKSSVTFGTGGLPLGFQYSAKGSSGTQSDQFFYPAFNAVDLPTKLNCAGTIDPLDPFNQLIPQSSLQNGLVRSAFMLTDKPTLPSYFRNSFGNAISLLPLGAESGQPPSITAHAGAFALTTNATVPSNPTTATPSLTLAGQFGVRAANVGDGQPLQLLCGIFGSEQISLTSYDSSATANDLLVFYLQSDAYAPIFPFTQASLNSPDSGTVTIPLDATCVSAWATVEQGAASAPTYHAEPAGSPMFGFPETIDESTDFILLEAAPPSLPIPQGASHVFPLVPYGGVASKTISADTYSSFESSILAASRKMIISNGATTTWTARADSRSRMYQARLVRAASGNASQLIAEEAAQIYRTTPQGMIATVDPDTGNYSSVTLGQTISSSNNNDEILPFAFDLPD